MFSVTGFYNTHRIHEAKPVALAREGVQTLKEMGYRYDLSFDRCVACSLNVYTPTRLIIVTARAPAEGEKSFEWVQRHFPGISAVFISEDVH